MRGKEGFRYSCAWAAIQRNPRAACNVAIRGSMNAGRESVGDERVVTITLITYAYRHHHSHHLRSGFPWSDKVFRNLHLGFFGCHMRYLYHKFPNCTIKGAEYTKRAIFTHEPRPSKTRNPGGPKVRARAWAHEAERRVRTNPRPYEGESSKVAFSLQ